MSQFTVYQNVNEHTRRSYPYLLDVQNDLLEGLHSRVVIPLCTTASLGNRSISNLCPEFEILGTSYTLLTPQMAGISLSELGPVVCDFSAHRFEIIKALDFLFTGF